MKKRISTRAICLAIAAVLLIGALTVSAINGSPYENLKNAVINAFFYESFTLEAEVTIRVDGQIHEHSWSRQYLGNDGWLNINSATGDESRASYTSSYFTVHPVNFGDNNVQWHMASRRFQGDTLFAGTPQPLGYTIFGAAGRNSNYLRLAEMSADLLIGDLKNNLTMSTQSDGTRRISGAITESQLPEIVRVLIDIAIDEQLRWANTTRTRDEFDNVLSIPMRNLTIDRIQGDADIDAYGNLLYVSFLGRATIENIFGDTHVVEIEGSSRFSDIGTTTPVNPFVGIEEILAAPRETRQVFFTLNDDGSINQDSVTTHWPQLNQHVR